MTDKQKYFIYTDNTSDNNDKIMENLHKQIMINGVDVSKCMFFNKNYKEDDVQIKNFCELQYISCKEFDCANCYFKKWKRKEQECKELRTERKNLKWVLEVIEVKNE